LKSKETGITNIALFVEKIIPGMEEYTAEDGAYWVCETCFEDFKDKFGWKLK